MDIGGRDRHALVAIQEGVVLNEALEQGCGLGNWVLVVPGLRSRYGASQRPEIAHSIGATELIYEDDM